MRILSLETSCDETAVAIAEFFGPKSRPKVKVFTNLVSSQTKLHSKFGGVVPNLAKREHQKNLVPILLRALTEAGLKNSKLKNPRLAGRQEKSKLQFKVQKIEKILEREPELLKRFKKYILPLGPPALDILAVTYGPGLAPALWVGVNFARALAYLWKKPLIPVNHMVGHLYSAILQQPPYQGLTLVPRLNLGMADIKFPAMALLVSGGHTELVLMRGHGKYKVIGETLDDAAGEAFDKVARLLGLKYPGGPEIARLAKGGDPEKYSLPRPMLNSQDYNFSFSGLKTAVLYLWRDEQRASKKDVAASFQKAVVDVLIKKTIRAAQEYKVKTVLLGGGVAANKLLRKRLVEEVKRQVPLAICYLPPAELTGDNAFMIAAAAFFARKRKTPSKFLADANARLS